MLRHLRDRQLVATYAIGFGVLFNFIATFTYVSFHLAAPPYLFSPTLLGALFFTYLASSPIVPWVGRAIALFGRRPFILGVIALWIVGALLLLAAPVSIIMTGLTLCAICGMVCQAVSTGYVDHDRQGGALVSRRSVRHSVLCGRQRRSFFRRPCLDFHRLGGCVAAIVAMQIVIAAIVAAAWGR